MVIISNPLLIKVHTHMKNILIKITSCLLAPFLLVGSLWAQPGETPRHTEPVNFSFGTLQGTQANQLAAPDNNDNDDEGENPRSFATQHTRVSHTVSASAEAPWIQLHFDRVNLGQKSYIIIESAADGDQQRFDAQSIEVWQNWSAMFKGNEVTVTVHVAPNDRNITIDIKEMLVGEFVSGSNPRSQCGDTDDRTQTSLPMRDGRIMPVTCTGWMHAGGFYATAGHCLDGGSSTLNIMEFDVPASLCDGTTQPAAIADQYPIIFSSIVWENGDIGDDWGLYDVGANSNTGLTPFQARRSYYHLTKANPTSNIQIRGYGGDNVPTGCTGGDNADNFTLQWHAGPNLGETVNDANDIYWEYQADTEGGNSGSAIRSTSSPDLHHAIGIHTNAGCSATSGNKGTSFEADDLEAAMNTFWQTQVEYVDVDHHLSNTTGSTVLPHYLLQNALNQANAGHGPGEAALELILIAGSNRLSNNDTETGGVYQEVIQYSGATNGVILRATCGDVKIGPNASN
jgi:hypothetical protein